MSMSGGSAVRAATFIEGFLAVWRLCRTAFLMPGEGLAVRPEMKIRKRPRGLSALRRGGTSVVTITAMLGGFASLAMVTSANAVAPVGSGLTVTASDIAFILKQIKISEEHSATLTPANPCGTLVGPGASQVPDRLTSYGLRTVDGSCNNLFPGRENFAAADVPFPRLTNPNFRRAEASPPDFFGPGSGTVPSSSYAQKKGSVFDSQPRLVSNLIVDQTSTNPAAIAAAEFPVRTQNAPGLHPCTTDPDPLAIPPVAAVPAGCVPSHQTLFIPNVTTDVGLSPPYNSMFTFFGQFFDHGVDQTVKSGGTVFVPLHADDPLITLGPDGKPHTGDEVPPGQQFMVLTRAQNQPGPDGILGDNPATAVNESADDIQNANNTDSPWVDQSQTYTSHASHQVFLREYTNNAGKPVSTGKLLGGLPAGQTYAGSPNGQSGISSWAATKKQAAELLGLKLVDADVTNIPMLATDPYGNFVPGPARGLPQYVTATGLVEGCRATDAPACPGPEPVPGNVKYFDTPFLTDIAHNADPSPVDADHNPATPKVAPSPDADNTPSANFATQPAGTYDNEMLDAHFTCGDGRCNENIALSSIHQVFHSEHDRLVGDIQNTLNDNPSLLADYQAPHPFGATKADVSFGFGGRLFQAARFVTEMEYQHLVFEEFARKVQPAVRPFHVYSPDLNPAVDAEFAHAVYRFGHSMLDDTVARTNADRSDNSLPLLTAFLNPPEFFNGNAAGTLTPEQAAGSIVMGSSDQVGNEVDEFVTETLRNNLLGLPLDLPTLNMARARDAGVPRLNGLRRQIFAQTNDGQLTPYTDWSDFAQHLKHGESLTNFVAAYGTHPSIRAATTAAGKRAAARAIVNPNATDVQPADAADFMFGTGAWANSGGVTTTGVDDIDLWVGGLAEVTNLFGGLLGPTFNYVFQTQLEKLQDGDRFYYLARTPGMNLRTQLEGNSFAELIMRNTEGTSTLKADAFATADCKFELGNLTFPAVAGSFITGAGSVNDDPTSTDCNENRLLLRKPDGTIQYRHFNSVNPSGINGQSVYNGTAGGDRVFGGNDNDTIWGNAGNDIIEGNGGDDVALGGTGNDIMTDLGGADVQKGGPGNDAIDAGIGDDIPIGGDGQDFINGGANDNETFAGPGNDFIIAGQGADAVFGDGGDDWIQGGSGQDLLIGDHGAPFFDDPAQNAPGNDIFIGQVGENDYDAEGGDDLMAANAAVDRNAGASGFDWAFHQYDTVGGNDDMEINNNLPGLPTQVVVNRDRWQETEADSGSAFNDIIKGTSVAPSTLGGAGFSGCDALDPTGVARIAGLDRLVTTFPTPLAPIVAASASRYCPLTGSGSTVNGQGTVWGEGDILLGGDGSDEFTGRGADDIIDGDHALSVRISVRTNPADPATEIGTTDLMEHTYQAGNTHTLQEDVFAGVIDPGNLVAVREITGMGGTAATTAVGDCGTAAQTNCDVAVFAAARATYTITANANGSLTVDSNGGVDGVDTIWNTEQLRFTDQTVSVSTPVAAVMGTATAGNARATVNWTQAPSIPAVTSFRITIRSGETVVGTRTAAANATSLVVTGLTNGTAYTFTVTAVSPACTGAQSARSNVVTPTAPTAPPAAVTALTAAPNGSGSVRLGWTPPAGPVTSFTVQVRNAANNVIRTIYGIPGTATGTTVTGLTGGTTYRFAVRAVNAVGNGPRVVSGPVTAQTVPGAPVMRRVVRGAAGGTLTASVNWLAPGTNGGSPITSYQVTTMRMATAAANSAVLSSTLGTVGSTARALPQTLPAGNYRFVVVAINAVGTSAPSARSANVVPR
ncbi:MAG TPA: peroxidase family protein [Kribbella sp.]